MADQSPRLPHIKIQRGQSFLYLATVHRNDHAMKMIFNYIEFEVGENRLLVFEVICKTGFFALLL